MQALVVHTRTAFVLQEDIQTIRDRGKKAYVAFLDVRKAFDTACTSEDLSEECYRAPVVTHK